MNNRVHSSLQHFEVFLKVAERQSFTVAAKLLGVTKSSVSQVINAMEKELNYPLFIRSTRIVRLTDEGKLLYQQCLRLYEELETTRHLLNSFHKSPYGQLKISSSPYFAERYLVKLIQAYQQKFPQVEVDVLVEERMPDMRQENIDIVFGVNWPAPLDVVARQIGQTRYVLCASPNYLQQKGKPSSLHALEQHCYIPHSSRAEENIIPALKKPRKLKLNTPLKINHANLLKKFALAGHGIISLHEYMVEDELKSGNLVEILQGETKKAVPIYIYYQKHRFVQPKIRQMVNLVFGDEFMGSIAKNSK